MNTATFNAEWTKVRTLRSTWATVIGAAALSLFFAADRRRPRRPTTGTR